MIRHLVFKISYIAESSWVFVGYFAPKGEKSARPWMEIALAAGGPACKSRRNKTRIGHQPLWDELSSACKLRRNKTENVERLCGKQPSSGCKSRRNKNPPCMPNHTKPLCTGCCMYSARRVSHWGNFIFPIGKLLFPQWETFVSMLGNFWNSEGDFGNIE